MTTTLSSLRYHGKPLTPREKAVLRLVSVGNSTREVAAILGLSPETVKAHRKHALAKLGARNSTHTVATAIREGIIQ